MDQEGIVARGGPSNDVASGHECGQPTDHTSTNTKDTLDNQPEVCEPAVGMSFHSMEAVKSFYRQYAVRKGFKIIIRNSRKGPDKKIKYFILACSRQGNYVSMVPKDLKTFPTIRNKCPAKITVTLKDGLWHIKSVNADHCHDLSPGNSRLLHGNKNMGMHMKRTIQINDEAGVRLNKSYHSVVYDARGCENMSLLEQDIRDFVGREGDGKTLLTYFARMQQYNNNFFYEIDLDDDFHVKNVFWADARSKATYEYFGDIVSFDTTCLTNKYDMALALFVGVNHHGQSILLGCGLLSAEDTESFAWLFQSWLRCMSGKAPEGIVTNQCKAIQNAVELVFPNARHRWCLWHIMKKIPKKLKGFAEYKHMKDAMKFAIYDSLTVDEFESNWTSFIDKFGLGDNDWLSGLYKERSKWVPCFLRQDFWAGMSTTHRSESIHAFFDGYVNATTLQQFVRQYDKALQDKAEKECEADFRSFNSTIPCGSNSMIERQFQAEYTHMKFNEVQAEFRAKMNCCVSSMSMDGSKCTYDVMEETIVVGHPKEAIFHVVFNRDNHDVKCSCLLFEFKGIMCRHSLLVLAQERVKEVSSKYVLNRWSKNVQRKYMYMKTSYDVK